MEGKTSTSKGKHRFGIIISPRLNANDLIVKTNVEDLAYFTGGKKASTSTSVYPESEIKHTTTDAASRVAALFAHSSTIEASPPCHESDKVLRGFKEREKSGNNHPIEGNSSRPQQNPIRESSNTLKNATILNKDNTGYNVFVPVPQEVEMDHLRSFSCFATPRMEPQSELEANREMANEIIDSGSIKGTEINRNVSKEQFLPGKTTGKRFWKKRLHSSTNCSSVADFESQGKPTFGKRVAKRNLYNFKGYRTVQQNPSFSNKEDDAVGFTGSQVFATQTQAQTHEDDMISFVVARNRLIADSKPIDNDVAQGMETSSRKSLTKPIKLRRLNKTELQAGSNLLLQSPPKRYAYTRATESSTSSRYTNSFTTSTFSDIVEVPETPHTLAPQVSAASTESLISNFLQLQVTTTSKTTAKTLAKKKQYKFRSYFDRIKLLPKVFNRDQHIDYDFGPISLPKLTDTSQPNLVHLQQSQESQQWGTAKISLDRPSRIQTRRNYRSRVLKSSTLGTRIHEDDRTRLNRLFIESESLEMSLELFEKYLDVAIK